MSRTAQPGSQKVAGSAAALADLVEEFTNRLRAGEAVDAEAFAAAHPEHAGQLREVLPALQVLAGLPSAAGPAQSPGPDADEPAPGVLGDFQIVREVARGGMGVVYEAVQVSLGRRVALKVLPFAATMDPRHLQRFHNEAQAAAGLQHQHIVPVYGVGCERGIHYYAMQFIDGQTLAEVIARQRQPAPPQAGGASPAGEPTTAYTPGVAGPDAPTAEQTRAATEPAPRDAAYYRRVAEWGIQAAEALEHAHSWGVVHRDVKPANLMIDAQGKLWVTDFGLARTPTDAGLTMSGDVLGTLRYMSPEQALARHGLVDHRSDVYSLGATLYELLTLRPAVDGKDRAEILHDIAFAEPPSPCLADRSVPVDLETVVLKALAKEPADRYQSARELADDLRRWVEDRPILARRPSAWQRAGRWARRNRSLVRALGVALALAFVALALSNLLVWRANRRKDDALRDRDEALRRMDLYLREVNARVGDREQAARLPLEILAAVDDLADAALAQEPGGAREANRQALLDRVAKLYQILLSKAGLVPERDAPQRAAWTRVRLGNLYALRGQFAQAREAYERACLFLRDGPKPFPPQTNGPRAGLSLPTDLRERAPPGLEEGYRRALEHWKRHSPCDWHTIPDYRVPLAQEPRQARSTAGWTLAELSLLERACRDLPTAYHWSQFASACAAHGEELSKAGRHAEAARVCLRAMAVLEQVPADLPGAGAGAAPSRGEQGPAGVSCHSLRAVSRRLKLALFEIGRAEEAEKVCRRAWRLHDRLPGSPDGWGSGDLMRMGLLHEVERLFRKALGREEAYRADLAKVYRQGLKVTEPSHKQALWNTFGLRWLDEPEGRDNFGILLGMAGRWDEAEMVYRQGLKLTEERLKLAEHLLAADPKNLAHQQWEPLLREAGRHNNLGCVLHERGRPGEARRSWLRGVAALEKYQKVATHLPQVRRDGTFLLLLLQHNLGTLDADTGRVRKAEQSLLRVQGSLPELAQALEKEKTFLHLYSAVLARAGQGRLERVLSLEELRAANSEVLAELFTEAGRPGEAEEAQRQALALREELGKDSFSYTRLNALAALLANCPAPRFRDPARAVRLVRKSMVLAPQVGDSWGVLGLALYRAGDWKGALEALAEADERHKGGDGTGLFVRAMAHWHLGEPGQARKSYDQAVRWMGKNRPNHLGLRRLRAEAAALLGIEEPQPEERGPPGGR